MLCFQINIDTNSNNVFTVLLKHSHRNYTSIEINFLVSGPFSMLSNKFTTEPAPVCISLPRCLGSEIFPVFPDCHMFQTVAFKSLRKHHPKMQLLRVQIDTHNPQKKIKQTNKEKSVVHKTKHLFYSLLFVVFSLSLPHSESVRQEP